MRGIKSFDFFQKISLDDVRQSTLYGAFISILAISLMIYLLFMEFLNFITPSIKRDTLVYHDPDQSSKININFGVRFPNMPCHILSVDQADTMGSHRMDIDETLKKTNIKSNFFGNEHVKKFVDVQKVIEAIDEKEGCFISGHIPVSKVAGNFHISHHNYANVFYYLKHERKDLFSKISLNHQFAYLYFGNKELSKDTLAKFGMTDFNSFNGLGKLPNYTNEKLHNDFDYFIKLIPHLFVDETNGEEIMTYQYSITHKANEYELDDEDDDMPIVQVEYDLSPITVKISYVRKSITHTLTHVCAIVGGVYVIFSLLNRLLNFLYESIDSEKKITSNNK